MKPKVKPVKMFVIVFALFLFFGITGSILLRSYNEKKYPERFLDDVEVVNDQGYDKSFPQIVNEPSRSAFVGEDYTFTPRIAPSDDDVNMTLLEGPEWLVFDGVVVSGTPSEIETTSFVLRLEKEGRYVDEEFFLVVNDGVYE